MTGPNIGQLLASSDLSPEQQALANFNLGQADVGTAAQFAQTPDSTMKTQSDVGNIAKKEFDVGRMSLADFNARSSFINQQAQGIGSLAGKLGGLAGGGGG